MGAMGDAAPGIYELGGPDVNTFRELMQQMLEVIRRRRLILGLPFWAGKVIAFFGAIGHYLTLGAFSSPITGDQVESLKVDNVVSEDAKGFAELGITPDAMEAILPEYLWPYRPSGQYNDIAASADKLRARSDQV
eukprot:TRINITY_DN27512_c0_g1_i1.p3 TRINITY_DN27512_c0_g1~~TRINITY_DN27512_c0_g1_i1.p3  ORF type:complete len:135 (-),score=45.57 TRINITY_DN27512_c0_g1_i1:162-566(-)